VLNCLLSATKFSRMKALDANTSSSATYLIALLWWAALVMDQLRIRAREEATEKPRNTTDEGD
jgi:hypothetical protein